MMKTFCAVDDASLIGLIGGAKKRIVFIAPGVHEPVASALAKRFREVDDLDVTVVLDPDEDVCRIGYGDAEGLKLLHATAQESGFWLKEQRGLRVGVLLADEITLVWSPTPRSVEPPPESPESQASPMRRNRTVSEMPLTAPNGVWLGMNPGAQLAEAVAAEGTNADPKLAEIGRSAITPQKLSETLAALEKNPPIPVDLARITRVFSSKLQFVQLTVNHAKISRSQLSISNHLLNAGVNDALKGLLESKVRAFADLRNQEVEVSAYLNGNAAFDQHQKPMVERVSEASLDRTRQNIEQKFIYSIAGFGRLIAKDEKIEFEKLIDAYTAQLIEHSEKLRKLIDAQSTDTLEHAVKLIIERADRSTPAVTLDKELIRKQLEKGLDRMRSAVPSVKVLFKDVTFEQTKNEDFRMRVDKALPPQKRKKLGQWTDDFDAARAMDKLPQ
ncbi:hypothetical protein [Caballeronia sp. SBC2]|uniref:hypothetical protein n=1 Tax=Caballeronia sp. SBC2 TaxID=2705547 RepID=UPI0013EB81B0|nr:hypothetical protein [Caballeronia sp. SBC2]